MHGAFIRIRCITISTHAAAQIPALPSALYACCVCKLSVHMNLVWLGRLVLLVSWIFICTLAGARWPKRGSTLGELSVSSPGGSPAPLGGGSQRPLHDLLCTVGSMHQGPSCGVLLPVCYRHPMVAMSFLVYAPSRVHWNRAAASMCGARRCNVSSSAPRNSGQLTTHIPQRNLLCHAWTYITYGIDIHSFCY